ncbi:MAG: hypothetical protein HOJ51_11660 [Tateyamaria sp.]|nr:hypothetical protein [Tateyamaria sp.]
MADKKINTTEINAILEVFAESREIKANIIKQSKTFKALLLLCNAYVVVFLVIYYFLNSNLLYAVDADLINGEFLTVFNGRANVMFWLFLGINMAAYFNLGFKVMCLIALVFMLNTTVDNVIIFSELISLDDRPYLTIFIVSRPLVFVALAWLALSFKATFDGNER